MRFTANPHCGSGGHACMLDRAGTGLFATLTPIIVADLMRGTGRYNLAPAAVATIQGIGVSLSSVVAALS
jgi:hypothetical protein